MLWYNGLRKTYLELWQSSKYCRRQVWKHTYITCKCVNMILSVRSKIFISNRGIILLRLQNIHMKAFWSITMYYGEMLGWRHTVSCRALSSQISATKHWDVCRCMRRGLCERFISMTRGWGIYMSYGYVWLVNGEYTMLHKVTYVMVQSATFLDC